MQHGGKGDTNLVVTVLYYRPQWVEARREPRAVHT